MSYDILQPKATIGSSTPAKRLYAAPSLCWEFDTTDAAANFKIITFVSCYTRIIRATRARGLLHRYSSPVPQLAAMKLPAGWGIPTWMTGFLILAGLLSAFLFLDEWAFVGWSSRPAARHHNSPSSANTLKQLQHVQQQSQLELQMLESLRLQLQQSQPEAALQLQLMQNSKQAELLQLQDLINELKHVHVDEPTTIKPDVQVSVSSDNSDQDQLQQPSPSRKQKQHLQYDMSDTTPDTQTQEPSSGIQGVICTVLRNEAKYIAEWIAFHQVMGATKFIVYDDNSTDSLRDVVAPFGDAVVVIDMYNDVEGVPGDAGVHRVAGRQDWAFNHCKTNYAPPNATGWFGIWDVDEFVFPCKRPAVNLDSNILWDAWKDSTKDDASGHQLRCSLFGVNFHDQPQPPNQLVLTNNIRRAPDSAYEPMVSSLGWAAVHEGCDKCGCCQAQGVKTVYNISKVHNLHLWTHGTHTQEAVIDHSWQKPHGGLCCNHYQFKSTAETLAKAEANLNAHYEHVGKSEDARKHLTMVHDTLAWQYLPDTVDLMQSLGFTVDVPEPRVAINAEGSIQNNRKRRLQHIQQTVWTGF